MTDVLPGSHNLTLYRGDTFSQQFTFTQSAAPLALPTTGWLCQVRAQTNSVDVLGEFTVDATDAATGVLVVSLTAAETATFTGGVYDLQVTDGSTVRTYLRGSVSVVRDVTRSV